MLSQLPAVSRADTRKVNITVHVTLSLIFIIFFLTGDLCGKSFIYVPGNWEHFPTLTLCLIQFSVKGER